MADTNYVFVVTVVTGLKCVILKKLRSKLTVFSEEAIKVKNEITEIKGELQ